MRETSAREIDRRTVLKGIGGATGTGGVLGASLPTVAAQSRSFVIEQGGNCVPVEPLSYEDMTVETFYGYFMPGEEPPRRYVNSGTEPFPYETNTPTLLARERVSQLFLYRGPDGLSLVVIHDRGGDGEGGAATFTITGLPEDGEWVVQDDNYDAPPGQPGDDDTWTVEGDRSIVSWSWNEWHNDGGAFRGLAGQFSVTIQPAFNDAAELEPETPGTIEQWIALSDSAEDPSVIELDLDEPVTIHTGACR